MKDIIIETCKEIEEIFPDEKINENTILKGENSSIESITLVTFISELEQNINEKIKKNISVYDIISIHNELTIKDLISILEKI